LLDSYNTMGNWPILGSLGILLSSGLTALISVIYNKKNPIEESTGENQMSRRSFFQYSTVVMAGLVGGAGGSLVGYAKGGDKILSIRDMNMNAQTIDCWIDQIYKNPIKTS